MLRYTTDRGRPGLVALYDIRPGNGAGQFLQPRSPHGAFQFHYYFVAIMGINTTFGFCLTSLFSGDWAGSPDAYKPLGISEAGKFTGRMPFLSPSQQCQSTEGNRNKLQNYIYNDTLV